MIIEHSKSYRAKIFKYNSKLDSLKREFNSDLAELKMKRRNANRLHRESLINGINDSYYPTLTDFYSKKIKYLNNLYKIRINNLKSKLDNVKNRESKILNVLSYDVPLGTVATVDGDGDIFYRWGYYTAPGDDNEQLSYSKFHKILF